MGCTVSKSLEMQARMEGWSPPVSRSFARSFSMPLRGQFHHHRPVAPPLEDTHTVALTSSTYGALRIPHEEREAGEKAEEEEGLQAESELRRRHEVKMELPTVPETEVIDLGELMRDLNEDESKSQQQQQPGPRRARGLSRSISSVDSIRELDAKIKSVALALPDVEKKLRALDALCSISRSEEPRRIPKSFLSDRSADSSPDRSRRTKRTLQSTKSMKGLFYGKTLPPPEPSRGQSSASDSASSSESDCSVSSSGISSFVSDSALFDPEILKTFQTEIDVSPTSPQQTDDNSDLPNFPMLVFSHDTNSVLKRLPKRMMSSKVAAIEVEEQRLKSFRDGFPAACPPKGENRAVLYVTSLRGIRKTFEACSQVRMILQGLGIAIDERDVSNAEFKQEMAELLSQISPRNSDKKPALPVPRLFIRGRYIGGVEEVAQLNEEGMMGKIVEGVAKKSPHELCEGCGGVRFVPCFECSGSCKKVVFGGKINYSGSGVVVRCPDCNENGLIRCPICL